MRGGLPLAGGYRVYARSHGVWRYSRLADCRRAGVARPLQTASITGRFCTYLGGKRDGYGEGIAVDSTGVYVTGATNSTDFPGAGNHGGSDIFVVKFSRHSGNSGPGRADRREVGARVGG